jgi:hypothetical protein
MARPDRDIQRHVEAELYCCPDVDETEIAVKVSGGTVTLSGYARSLLDKYAAEEAVKRVAGVVAVANDVVVQAREAKPTPPATAPEAPADPARASFDESRPQDRGRVTQADDDKVVPA